ncbi:MAG: helix-turn-helix domain-containing protein [Planctomycetes bacterium]|nr:helix-turn-helix domain-containing protein [Planctomycetota bacterium]
MRAVLYGERSVETAVMNETSPLALRPRDAAKALGISPRLLWQLTEDGKVPCVRVGGSKRQTVLYPIAELQTWLSERANASKGGVQ